MGYDYYWINEPSAEQRAKYDTAHQQFSLAAQARNALDPSERGGVDRDLKPCGGSDRWRAAQAAVEDAYDAMSQEQVWSFRLNLFGGRRYASAMDHLNMVGDTRAPNFPDLAAHPALRALPDEIDQGAMTELIVRHPNLADALSDVAMRRLSSLLSKVDHLTPGEQNAARSRAGQIMAGLRSYRTATVPAVAATAAAETSAGSEKQVEPSEQLRGELFTAITGEVLSQYETAEWRYLIEHPEAIAQAQAHHAATNRVLRFSPRSDRMWWHKIAGSNDGWINTPEEISGALRTYRDTDPEIVAKVLADSEIERDYWDRWIGFLDRAAAEGGGFATY